MTFNSTQSLDPSNLAFIEITCYWQLDEPCYWYMIYEPILICVVLANHLPPSYKIANVQVEDTAWPRGRRRLGVDFKACLSMLQVMVLPGGEA